MKRATLSALVVLLATVAAAPTAHAQRAGFARLFRPYHQVVLVQLDEVGKDIKIKDDQTKKAQDLSKKLREDRNALFQKAAGDFDSVRDDLTKLTKDIAKQLSDALDEPQRKRVQEIFIQANGPTALFDEDVAAALKLTKEQQDKLVTVRNESFGDFQGVDWQSLDDKSLDAKVDEIIKSQDEKYAAVMTEEQRAAFKKLGGEAIKIDLTKLPNPFGG